MFPQEYSGQSKKIIYLCHQQTSEILAIWRLKVCHLCKGEIAGILKHIIGEHYKLWGEVGVITIYMKKLLSIRDKIETIE